MAVVTDRVFGGMTVAQLIGLLQRCPLDAMVNVHTVNNCADDGVTHDYEPVDSVESSLDHGVVLGLSTCYY